MITHESVSLDNQSLIAASNSIIALEYLSQNIRSKRAFIETIMRLNYSMGSCDGKTWKPSKIAMPS